MSTDRMHDVAVVGGGHNGLTCAAYLARAGLDVVVLERRPMLGGAAVTEEPWPGYRVSSGSYVVSLFPPRLLRELQLDRFGYRVTLIEPDYYIPFPDGRSLSLWSDPRRSAEEIARFSRADAAVFAEFDAYFQRVGRLLRDLMFSVPPNVALSDLPHWIALASKLRHWSRRDVVEAVRLFTLSAADFLDEWFQDDRVKAALATQALIGGWGGPLSPGSAIVLVHHWMGETEGHPGGWGWVHGGMGALSESLAAAAREAGAETRVASPVLRALVEGERTLGVQLTDGSVVRARRVVSNAHPVTTYLELVGEQHLPSDVVADLRRYRSRSGSVKVNLALGELPRPSAWEGPVPGDPHRGLFATAPSIEYLERAWDDAKYGRTSESPYVEMVLPTVLEPGLAPAGKHIALCFTQFGPYELASGSWDTEREAYAGKVIATLGEYCPNLEGAVEHIEVLAPPDIEERFGLIGGNLFQGDMIPSQLFCFRPVPGYADYRTPIEGLYLCGSATHPGGGVMGVPGRNAAQVVLRDARRNRWRAKMQPRQRPARTETG